jgi:hypothetical protein
MKKNFCSIMLLLIFLSTASYSQNRVTARHYFPVADSIAHSLLDELFFIKLRSEDVDTLGKSIYWEYAYQNLYMLFGPDSLVVDTTFGEWTGSSTINKGWFDSDSAIQIAELNGGREFRNLFSEYTIMCDLGEPSGLLRTVWRIIYRSTEDANSKIDLSINALDGTIVYNWSTNIKKIFKPEEIHLYQNYPNPFNPETTITFTLPKSTDLSLRIYNVRGDFVTELINGKKSSGAHSYKWGGTNQSGQRVGSGVYIYHLKSLEFNSRGKMILVR